MLYNLPMPARKSPRPTQAERSAATRELLLNATLRSMAEDGYAATTTRSIAKRAGISQGALQHHYKNKTDLVEAALLWTVQKTISGLDLAGFSGSSEREKLEYLIDQLWAIHNLDFAPAVLEMFNLGRTDPRIAALVAKFEQQGNKINLEIAQAFLPEMSALPGFSKQLVMATSLMRGTVMLSSIPGVKHGYADWPSIRKQILANLDNLPAADSQ